MQIFLDPSLRFLFIKEDSLFLGKQWWSRDQQHDVTEECGRNTKP